MRRPTRRELCVVLALVGIVATVAFTAPVEATVYKWFAGLRVGSGAPTTSAINLASGTTTAAGIAFGSDAVLYRSASAQIANSAGMYVYGDTILGNASTDTITATGRLVLRTLGADPLDGTPGNRPAGSVGEIAYYSGVVYLCTNASTPTWVKVGPES